MDDEDEPVKTRKTCEVCGQTLDLEDLDQVFHHDGVVHEPLSGSDAA